jgi:hypothetical protein
VPDCVRTNFPGSDLSLVPPFCQQRVCRCPLLAGLDEFTRPLGGTSLSNTPPPWASPCSGAGGLHRSQAEGVEVQTVAKSIEETDRMLRGKIVLKSFWHKYLLVA